MPRISEFFGISIAMFYSDHQPPHFHAAYSGQEGSFRLDTLELLDGQLPLRAQRLIREWAQIHRGELAANWDRARAGLPLDRISPLE
jgi:hypothetical protein